MLSILTKDVIGCGFNFFFQIWATDKWFKSASLSHHELASHSYQPKNLYTLCYKEELWEHFDKKILQQNEPKHNVLAYWQTHILWWLALMENHVDRDISIRGMGEFCYWCLFHTSLQCTKYVSHHPNQKEKKLLCPCQNLMESLLSAICC